MAQRHAAEASGGQIAYGKQPLAGWLAGSLRQCAPEHIPSLPPVGLFGEQKKMTSVRGADARSGKKLFCGEQRR